MLYLSWNGSINVPGLYINRSWKAVRAWLESLLLSGLFTGSGKVLKHIRSLIEQYIQYGYSLIPIDEEKKPHIYWKKYQYRKAPRSDILNWLNEFRPYNIGIVTGNISRLAVVDVDDLSLLPELKEEIPEITETTRVRANRGYHYYFSLNGENIRSTNNLFGKNLELKSNGNYIVAPPSVINNHRYTYEVPLDNILPIPEILTTDNRDSAKFAEKNIIYKIPEYHGHKMDCIRKILKRELREGERDNGLFVLYNLFLQNKNSTEYSRKVVERKNFSLGNPLPGKDLKKIYRKSYHYGCSGIREKLPYVRCEKCTYRFKGGQLSGSNILVRSLRLLPELTNTQRSVACLLGTVFDGENPSIYRIAKEARMDWGIVKKAIRELKEKGFPVK